MAHPLTVAEAEAAYLKDLESKRLAKQKSTSIKLAVSAALVALAIGSLIFGSSEEMRWIGTGTILFGVPGAIFAMDVLLNRSPAKSSAALRALRASQRNWIESHGFRIPIGSFEHLAFAVIPERGTEQTYGVAQLIEISTDKLLSISLRSDAEGNYQLFGTDGQILRPTAEVS